MKIDTITPSGIPAVSSLEIAKLTGKNHGHVLRDIEKVLKSAEIDQSKFGSTTLDSFGREQPYYLLPRFECDLVISGYSVKYRAAIIRRWHELEAHAALTPKQKLLAQLAELLTAEEKVVYLDAFKPAHEYGSMTADGRQRLGIRRASFVAAASRLSEAEQLWETRQYLQRQLDEVNGQLRLAI